MRVQYKRKTRNVWFYYTVLYWTFKIMRIKRYMIRTYSRTSRVYSYSSTSFNTRTVQHTFPSMAIILIPILYFENIISSKTPLLRNMDTYSRRTKAESAQVTASLRLMNKWLPQRWQLGPIGVLNRYSGSEALGSLPWSRSRGLGATLWNASSTTAWLTHYFVQIVVKSTVI